MNKKFESLGTALNRDQAKKIVGGLMPPPDEDGGGVTTTCTCNGSPGSWTYASTSPIPTSALIADVKKYCPGANGTCKAYALSQA